MRDPGYESLDRNGANRPNEGRRETMAERQAVGIGRPRGAAARAAAPRARREQISDIEARRLRLRVLELERLP